MSGDPVAEDPIVYAIADTHFGLRERGPAWDSDSPEIVAAFVRWLEGIGEGGAEVKEFRRGAVAPRILQSPTHLILLGDILELWDAENQAVLLSSNSIAPVLSSLKAEKVYVLGNHDSALKPLLGQYPFGLPGLTIVEWVFPAMDEKEAKIPGLDIGDNSYIFIHGHQLDVHFRRARGSWRSFSQIRQFGAALGAYAWWFLAITVTALIVQLFVSSSLLGWVVVTTSALLWIPRFIMRYARRIWKAFAGKRFRHSPTLDAFRSLWRGLSGRFEPADNLGIVYGHTHILDFNEITPEPGKARGRSRAERRFNDFFAQFPQGPQTFYNISSWVSTHGRFETVIWATIFYADKRGPMFLGWDWRAKRPFHIPFEFVVKRRRDELLDSADLAVATSLEWPPKLIEKWRTTREGIR